MRRCDHFRVAGGPNYVLVEHAPLDARRGVYPATPGPTGKPSDPRGTGGPAYATGGVTPGPGYIIGPAAAAYVLVRHKPTHYRSNRRGWVRVEEMHEVWRARAARAVEEGRRPGEPRGIVRALRRGLGRLTA